MDRNINDASLANLKHYQGKWQSGATRTIRVPIALADDVLEYARQLDSGTESLDTSEASITEEAEQDDDNQSVAEFDKFIESLDTGDLLDKLKGRLKKSKATERDIEVLLEILKESW